MGATNSYPRTLALPDGRQITLPQRPTRIVSLSSATDETVCVLLAPNQLHGIISVSPRSLDPEASNIVELAKQIPHNAEKDAEQIVALKPDLVLAGVLTPSELRELIRQAGIPLIVTSDYRNADDIAANTRLIGRAVGEETRAEQLVSEMNEKLNSAKSKLKPERAGLRVLYLSPGFGTAGTGTMIDERIKAAGLLNVATEAGIKGAVKIAAEQIIGMKPDVIIVPSGGGDAGWKDRVLADPQLAPLEASKKGRVIEIPGRYIRNTSHFVGDGTLALVNAINNLPDLSR